MVPCTSARIHCTCPRQLCNLFLRLLANKCSHIADAVTDHEQLAASPVGLPLYAHYGHKDVQMVQSTEQHLLESMLLVCYFCTCILLSMGNVLLTRVLLHLTAMKSSLLCRQHDLVYTALHGSQQT